jgi:EVE domain
MTVNRNEDGPQAWIFQGNPRRYANLQMLTTQPGELWNLRQYAREVRVGDRVYIWLAGEAAGIYAVGTVLTSPVMMVDSPLGIRQWTDPREGRLVFPRVEVCYDRVLLDQPLLKQYLRTDPILRDLTILRMPRATNYPLTAAQAGAIEDWLADGPS